MRLLRLLRLLRLPGAAAARCRLPLTLRSSCHLRILRYRSASSAPPQNRTAKQIRSDFIEFYRARGHELVKSSPVRPRADPSLLFVNAGMNQFKPLLLGVADPRTPLSSLRRVVNSQKCVRAGGKHNDLDDVGKDGSHHTFFEMMGSWSFGDYFKSEACSMAWTLLTEVYHIPKDQLYVSYFSGHPEMGLSPDLETREVWLQLGVPSARVLPFGLKENFWEMGDTGPCGPCTEIHVDLRGARDAAALVNQDCPEVLEVWNLVFMEYNRQADSSLWPLPLRSVDTGLGLERLVSILQQKSSNYDTDLFLPLILHLHQLSGGAPYSGGPGLLDTAYRVVVDHIRTLAICIADGVHPGMSGAELVLRRILRRAVRFSLEVLKAPEGTLGHLVPTVAQILGEVYPELCSEQQRIVDVINENEAQFLSSLKQGTRLIQRTLHKLEPGTMFPAGVAWSLHRDLGFPLDLVDLILDERGVCVDPEELDRIRAQNQVALDASGADDVMTLDVGALSQLQRRGILPTDDSATYKYFKEEGKYVFPSCWAQILALVSGGTLVDHVSEGLCGLILDQTCFYSERGGQSRDQGFLSTQEAVLPLSDVTSCGGYVLHVVQVSDLIQTGDTVQLHLDQSSRLSLMMNHTATHLLNFALRRLLGPNVHQRGSSVSVTSLRFDYSTKEVDLSLVPHWTRRVLQNKLKTLQRNMNTTLRKMEIRQASLEVQTLLQKHRSDPGPTVDVIRTHSPSVLMKTVNKLSSSLPGSFVMLLAQVHSGKVLCACQVPKGVSSFSASDWALAVCGRFHGNAGGSELVAKGMARADDVTAVLEWAELYAKKKMQR
ncbi:alanine--tRNA ligase, mitochondrial isoform X2 [Eucyclogobius newberryi]|uniref:alanine--tRNA ligase, mitochondrial isoform X2 n=1 Tax=Eucyclogobius newberryi TaxID=166745 RepID=UPI003B5CF8BE